MPWGRRAPVRADAILKRSLITVWSLWWTVVFATNLADAAKALGLLGQGWAFASGNYRLVTETIARYGPPPWLSGLLFFGVLCGEGLIACLFWRASWLIGVERTGQRAVRWAFIAAFTLWGAFLIADEICAAYAVEATHVRVFTAQMVTLLVLECLLDAALLQH
jgi:hypothetical protein